MITELGPSATIDHKTWMKDVNRILAEDFKYALLTVGEWETLQRKNKPRKIPPS